MAVGFPTKANWAAGDVLTASAQDDLAGTVNLLSNASATTGSQLLSNAAGTSFAYSATPSSSNPCLNSGMNVWQRGTSVAVSASTYVYTADRWQIDGGSAITVSRQATSDSTNLPFIQYCARVQRNSGQTNTSNIIFNQPFESVNSIPFAGKAVTLSFYARAGANYSQASSGLGVQLTTGTGTDQNPRSGSYTGQAFPINQTATLTTTWQRFTYSGTVAATATEMAVMFPFTPVGTAGTNDYYEITGVQIDIGSVALPFRTYAATYQGELAACQRYLPCIDATNTSANPADSYIGYAYGTNTTIYCIPFPVQARTNPTGITLIGSGFVGYALNTSYSITPSFDAASLNYGSIISGAGITIIAGQGSRMSLATNGKILFTGCEL